MAKKLICAVFPARESTAVVASVLEDDPIRAKRMKALFADLAIDVCHLVAGTTLAHGTVVYVALDAVGESERRLILDSCAVALDVELPTNSKLILIENADTLVEAGLLDSAAKPSIENCLVKVG